jgi:hypothetical protein
MKPHWLAFGCGIAVMCAAHQVWLTASASQDQMQKPPRRAQTAQEMPVRAVLACGVGMLTGGYALALEGPISAGNLSGPYAGVGVLNFDGAGNVAVRISQSFNGAIQPVVVTAGRYSLAEDCTGSLILSPTARFDLVTSGNGREINFLQTNPGNVIYGVAKKQ